MTIPVGFGQITHFLGGPGLDRGAAVVYGIDLGAVLDPAVAAQTAHEAWADDIMGLVTVDVVLQRTLCKFGPDDTGPFADYVLTDIGSKGGSMAPPNVAALVQKRTALGGREGRGRMFVPGLPEAEIEPDGNVQGAVVTLWNTQLATFLGDLASGDIPMTVLHESATAPSLVIELQMDQRVATQRRRLR